MQDSGFLENYWLFLQYSVNNPVKSNSLFVVIWLSILFLILEFILPKKMNYGVLTRKGFFTDFVYMFFYDFILVFPIVFGIDGIIKWMIGPFEPIYDITTLPFWGLIIVMFVLNDFVNWLGHLILHKVTFLWKFHKIHHAQKELGFGSTRHFHFMEYFVFRPLMFVPFNMLGVLPTEYLVFQIWVSYGMTFLSHANIKIPWGPFKYIFITPDTHYWHHAKNVASKHSVNYASILTLWDLLFGYFYLPKEDKKIPKLGLYNDSTPNGFFKQQIYPFAHLTDKEEKPNFIDD